MRFDWATEIEKGERFAFGANWTRFLRALDEERVVEAEESLKRMLSVTTLAGKTFLDAGSGSGLFSLAARRLGARVHSFDYDKQSVACTAELRRQYFPADLDWTVNEGSLLDLTYMESLNKFDVVYCWGVLHHTGAMWTALENVLTRVADSGRLFVAIYNDEGLASRYWRAIKRTYAKYRLLRGPLIALHVVYPFVPSLAYRWIVRGTKPQRGMSPWRDLIDWVGGYPYEFATPDAIFEFHKQRGFRLEKLATTNRSGCNQFVFSREDSHGC